MINSGVTLRDTHGGLDFTYTKPPLWHDRLAPEPRSVRSRRPDLTLGVLAVAARQGIHDGVVVVGLGLSVE